jgi:hypothetical protein
MISTTSAAFEPESHEAWQNWLAETNRTYYALGPLQPEGFQSNALANSTKLNDLRNSQNGQELLEFLDSKLKIHGLDSLLYVSYLNHGGKPV